MIILKQNKANIYIFTDSGIIIYNSENGNSKDIKIADPPPELNKTQPLENKQVSSVCVSKDSKLLCITRQNKQLIVYDGEFKIVKNILTNRAVSSVQFTHTNDIIIADKTGDVYLYKLNNEYTQPELLLGHLSMLLNIILSECEKFIITSDRDEKIRVSCYPNCYNIVSYCLGHREFVTKIDICDGILISASGDGTIRCWDFLNGKEISCIDTNEHIADKSLIEEFCKQMDSESVDIFALPITDMQSFRDCVTYIGITLLGFSGVQVYYIKQCDGKVTLKFLRNVMCCADVVAFSLNSNLVILTSAELTLYNLSNDNFVKVNSDKLNEFYNSYKTILSSNLCNSSIYTFYKRKYNNLEEYMERKKLRIENKQ